MSKIKPKKELLDKILILTNCKNTAKEIAKILNISPTTVRKYLHLYLNTSPYTKRNQDFKKEYKLTNLQKEVLLGSLLGDMGMELKYKNARFSINHGGKQEQYFDYKCNIFNNFIKSINKKYRFDIRTNKYYNSYKTHSITNCCFNDIYNMFYINNKKIVTEDILNQLTPLSLAVWYMDDGDKTGVLATNSFSLEECILIKNYFKTKWNIDTTIQTTKNKQYLIYFTKNGKKIFYSLTHKYFIPSMLYKIENWNP